MQTCGVSQVCVHLDSAPYSTQQVMAVILAPSFQVLGYFLGQERMNCWELP